MEKLTQFREEKRRDVWNKILTHTFTSTYNSILSEEDISIRVQFIISNLMKLKPINIFKSILYSDTSNEIGKLAIDYRLKFISSEYESCIRKGESYEIDNIEFEEKHILTNEIRELCIALNMAINNEIMNGKDMDIRSSIDFLADVISVKHREPQQPTWNLHHGVQHLMSINQIVYSVVFNQNPFDGEIVNEKYQEYIRTHFRTRCLLFEKLHEKYHSGIKLSYVQNRALFG